MLDIRYKRDGNLNEIELSHFHCFDENDLPLNIIFKTTVGRQEAWRTEIHGGMWANWSSGAIPCDVLVTTKNGKVIVDERYNVEKNGDQIEKMLWYFIKKLDHHPKGLVIGCHDGLFGHWVHPTIHGMTDVLLVDGGAKQLCDAKLYYEHLSTVSFLQAIVTPDGKDVCWYESGEGYTDTVKKHVISLYLPDEAIKASVKPSMSINDVISSIDENVDWLHIDTEGLDGDLIQALEYEPPLIIFERVHLEKNTSAKTFEWLRSKNYRIYDEINESIAIKNTRS